jgi:hypothetical protein
VGKTHLAVSLGLKAIEAGYRVLFTTAANLIAALTKAHAEGRLDEKLKVYTTTLQLMLSRASLRGRRAALRRWACSAIACWLPYHRFASGVSGSASATNVTDPRDARYACRNVGVN